MTLVDRTLRVQRAALGVAVAGSALLFSRATLDVFNTVKATVVLLAALTIAVAGMVRLSRTRRLELPVTPALYAVGAFVAALVVATAVSPTTMLSVVGRSGRHTGLVMYATYAFLLVAAIRLYRDRLPDGLIVGTLAAAAVMAGYGLLQAAGADPFAWQLIEGGPPVFSTLGNANFFAAWLGIVVPLAVLGALRGSWEPAERAACAVLAVLALAAATVSTSLQGLGAAATGTALLLAVWLFTAHGRIHRLRWLLAAGGAALGTAAVGAVLAGLGPLESVRASAARSLETRVGKWETALLMAADRPLFGFGLDTFVDWFHAYRPVDLAVDTGLRRTTDTPHMVPLDMLASGGALLLLAHIAVLGVTAWALVSGLRRTDGERRLVLAGLGGAWVAYLVQSLVSIDVPPLATIGWVLAGLVIAVGTQPALRSVELPGAPPLPARKPGTRRKKARPVPLAPASPALYAAVALLAVTGLWLATTPVRADAAAASAEGHDVAGEFDQAVEAWERAASVGFWETRYPARHGAMALRLGDAEQALALQEEAAAREPRGLAHQINIARAAALLNDHERTDAAFDRALELDPHTPEVLVEVAEYRLSRDEPGDAKQLLEVAVARRADEPDWWVALGRARSAAGDLDGAREAFLEALALDPDAEGAEEALERLTS